MKSLAQHDQTFCLVFKMNVQTRQSSKHIMLSMLILKFKIIVSILILFQVWAVSVISNRLRGGGMTTALGQSIQLLWIADTDATSSPGVHCTSADTVGF